VAVHVIMNKDSDLNKFVKDPSLLVDLCRQVIEELDTGSNDTEVGEKNTQLREIARTIERLEKAGVPTPEALRAEKMRLAAELGGATETTQALTYLGEELEALLKDIKARLRHDRDDASGKKTASKRSHLAKTDKHVLREHIVRALKKCGGKASVADVLQEMGRQLKGKLLPGDLELRKDGKTIAWMNNAQWQRLLMVREGILRNDSPNGIWELAENHR
jgi:hypothetical protein